MRHSPFTPAFEALPAEIPIFPLPGAICLPRQNLPLNIFEPRYLAMVDHALAHGRLFAMVQPRAGSAGEGLYDVGCACRITAFQETDDGRYLIQLVGVSRLRLGEELDELHGFRRVRAHWDEFRDDLGEPPEYPLTLDELRASLDAYAEAQSLSVEWEGVEKLPGAFLVDLLAITLPFDVEEKQALVEAPTVAERADILRTTLAMGTAAPDDDGVHRRH